MPYTLKKPILLARHRAIKSAMSPKTRAKTEAIAEATLCVTTPRWPRSISSIALQINKNFPNADKQTREVLVFAVLMEIYEELESSDESDFQDCLQEQQQLIQIISNVMKQSKGTSVSVVRNLR